MNFIKENLITIILLLLIVVILVVFGLFIYKIVNDKKDINNEQTFNDIFENEYIGQNTIVQCKPNSEDDEEKNSNFQINDSRLTQIVDIFNNSDKAKKMKEQGNIVNAMALENKIIIFSSSGGYSFNVEYILNDNILSAEISYKNTDSRISAIKLILAIAFLDSVGQYKGYPENLISTALENDEAMNYTLDNEGIEIKGINEKEEIIVRVDLNSNFPFLNS